MGDIIKLGGDRSSLTAKVFGAGHVLTSVTLSKSSVPSTNIQFIKAFLSMEGITILKSDVGGYHGRKVLFVPHLNKVFVKRLVPEDDSALAAREKSYQSHLRREVKEEDLVLFK